MGILSNLFHFLASCPYGDKECPKIEELKKDDVQQDSRLANLERILYIIVGMIAINWGIALW